MKKSIFLFFAAILCAIGMNAATPTKIYLNAQDWGYGDARYAAYFFDPAKWVDMKKVDGETFIYEVDVPAGYTKVILCRMNGGTTTNNWDNKWNQTGDLNIPTDGRNIFKPDDWNGKTTTWSTYTPPVTHTFAKNSTLYVDFRAITDKKKANYPKAGSVGIDYSANAGGTVIPVTFTADVKWAEGTEFIKTEKGEWASIPFKAPEVGQNCAQVAADGKSYTWTTFSEPSVTLSLDKTEADAGTEVTVTLTATADNVSGEVTYAFQYSTDNATWNNITATGNTATQTFAAETRYYKVTMTNGGTTKEATAKFSAIKFHVIGSWNSWTAHDEVVEGSKTITLEANKTYEYKITNGTWDLSWGNGGTMDRDNCTDWTFETTYGNAKIETDEAGDYVFNVSRNTEGKVVVSVTYPELSSPIPTFDYYIVGSFNGDDPKKAENGMTLDGTVYKATVTLAAGENTLKVTDGTWDNTWGYGELGADYEEVSNAGAYNNIKITLAAEKTITVIFDATGEGKITFEGLTPVTYSDIVVQVYSETTPYIWWWNGGSKCPDAEAMDDPNNAGSKYTFKTAPAMTPVTGETNWYEWTFEDVNENTGINIILKNSNEDECIQAKKEGIKVSKICYDARNWNAVKETDCGETPTDCEDCSGYFLVGAMNNWDAVNEFIETAADGNIAEVTIHLTGGTTTEFKIKKDANMYGNTGTMKRVNSGQAWTFQTSISNAANIYADVTGDYLFSWNISEKKLTVTYPEFPDLSNQPSKIYFRPNANWKKDNAIFKAFFLNGDNDTDNKWGDLTDADGDGIYEVANEKKHLSISFVRMNPAGTDPDPWKNKWNQSADIIIPTQSYLNCLIDESNSWDTQSGTWTMLLSSGDNSAAITAAAGNKVTALVNRSFTKDDGWYTLCVPFNMPASGVGTAYQISGLKQQTSDYVEVYLSTANNLTAGAPYLIEPSKTVDYLLVKDVTIVNTTGSSINKSITGLSVTMQAVINGSDETNGSTEYWVGNGGYLYNDAASKLGLRSYFNISTTGTGLPPRFRVVTGENEATGIEDIITTDAPVKVIENGQLIIIREGVKYNVQGQKL